MAEMSGPGAGFEYPVQEVSWLKRDVLLFANSIGCTADELHFLYVGIRSSLQLGPLLRFIGTPPTVLRLPYLPHSLTYSPGAMVPATVL